MFEVMKLCNQMGSYIAGLWTLLQNVDWNLNNMVEKCGLQNKA